MNKQVEALKLVSFLPRYYLKASRLLKQDDTDKAMDYIKEVANGILKSSKIKLTVINLNDTTDFTGSFVLANHQSNYDIFALLSAFDCRLKFIAKKELFKLPLFKTFIELSQSYSLDRNDPRQGVKLFKETVKDVDVNDSNIAIFPEGTRAQGPLMLEFNSGLFNIIRRTKKSLIPVYIDHASKNEIKVIIGKEITAADFNKLSGLELRDLIYDKVSELKSDYASNKIKYNVLGLGDSITFGEDYRGEYIEGFYHKTINRLNKEGLLNKSCNLAIPGATIADVEQLILKDDYQKRLSAILNKEDNDELLKKLIKQKNKTVNELIKDSDYLILSAGANDILQIVKKGKVTKEDVYDGFEELYEKTSHLLKVITNINPNLKIILVGLYFPYPHSRVLQKFNKMKILDLYYHKLELKYKNVKALLVSEQIEQNKDCYVPSRRNIHLSKEGYDYIAEKIIDNFGSV